MPAPGDTLEFAFQFQKGGVNTVPSVVPTMTLVDPTNTTTTGLALTVIDAVNLPGAYKYLLPNAVLGNYVAEAITTDQTVDQPDIPTSILVESTGGTAPTVQQIVNGVWDEATSSHTVAGSFGQAINNLLARIASSIINVLNPLTVQAKTRLSLIAGDSYQAGQNNALTFSNPFAFDMTIWTPSLELTTITGIPLVVTGTITTSGTIAQFTLTQAQTLTLANGIFDAYIILGSNPQNKVTLGYGVLNIITAG